MRRLPGRKPIGLQIIEWLQDSTLIAIVILRLSALLGSMYLAWIVVTGVERLWEGIGW